MASYWVVDSTLNLPVGIVSLKKTVRGEGWWFFSLCQATNSRKMHDTPEAAARGFMKTCSLVEKTTKKWSSARCL